MTQQEWLEELHSQWIDKQGNEGEAPPTTFIFVSDTGHEHEMTIEDVQWNNLTQRVEVRLSK